MQIEVAYATLKKQMIIPLVVNEKTSIIEAIHQSKIDLEFTELDLSNLKDLVVGVFGKKIDINTYVLQEQDRIEIYRPLAKTPNQRRLERAKNQTT